MDKNINAIFDIAAEIYSNTNANIKDSIEIAKGIDEDSEIKIKIGGKKKMDISHNTETKINQKEELEKLLSEGKTVKEIAKILGYTPDTISSRIYKYKLKSPRLRQLEEYERRRMTGYIPPQLEIGKEYQFAAKNVNGKVRTGTHSSRVKGKIIEEYKNFYRVNIGKYVECMNKNDLMNYQIKAI